MIDWVEADVIYGDLIAPSRTKLDFVSNCELCGAHLYVYNFIIENDCVSPVHRLRVGSECVKRFPALKGVSQGEVGSYVDQYSREQGNIVTVRRLAMAFGTKVVERMALVEFRKAAEALVGPIVTVDDWNRKGPVLLQHAQIAPDTWLADRVAEAFLDPTGLPLTKGEGKAIKEMSEERLRQQFGWVKHRKSRVEHVGSSRSDLYKQNRLDRRTTGS